MQDRGHKSHSSAGEWSCNFLGHACAVLIYRYFPVFQRSFGLILVEWPIQHDLKLPPDLMIFQDCMNITCRARQMIFVKMLTCIKKKKKSRNYLNFSNQCSMFAQSFIVPLWKSGDYTGFALSFWGSVITFQMKLEYLLRPVSQSWSNFIWSLIRVGERLHKDLGQIGLKLWFPWQQKGPLTYNGENDVSAFSLLFWNRSFFKLAHSNFDQIGPLPTELGALERLKNFPCIYNGENSVSKLAHSVLIACGLDIIFGLFFLTFSALWT